MVCYGCGNLSHNRAFLALLNIGAGFCRFADLCGPKFGRLAGMWDLHVSDNALYHSRTRLAPMEHNKEAPMHAKRQGLLAALLDAVLVAVTAPVVLFKVVLFKVVFANAEPQHLKSTPVRSKGWGRKVVFVAVMLATLALLVVPAFAASAYGMH